jgi:outer membrane protein TolC
MFISSSRRHDGLRSVAAMLTCASLIGVPLAGRADQAPALSLRQAVSIATERSQGVAAAEAGTAAAREQALAAGRLPDPVLRIGLNNLPIDGPDRYSVTRDFMTMRSVGVMQELTREGKRQVRRQRAEQEVEAARIARRAVVAELQRDAALAWLDRSFQESMRELLRAQIEQAVLQGQTAEALHRSGKGTLAEVFSARAAVEQLRDALDQTERQIAIATTRLGRWTGPAAIRPLGERPPLALPAWTAGELAPHLEQHPQIAAALQQEALAESDAALARAARSSDWSVELMVSQRGTAYSNMVSLNLSVPLQWDQSNRQDRDLAARLAGLAQVQARREDLQHAHEAEVRAMLQAWRSHEERLRRYDDALLPLAGQRSEAALAAYRAGTGPLGAVLDARRGELEIRMEKLRIEIERARVWAEINYLLPAHDAAGSAAETTR